LKKQNEIYFKQNHVQKEKESKNEKKLIDTLFLRLPFVPIISSLSSLNFLCFLSSVSSVSSVYCLSSLSSENSLLIPEQVRSGKGGKKKRWKKGRDLGSECERRGRRSRSGN
jgi:hypothetical protein